MKKYYIENMPHVNESIQRVESWLEQEITDRPPVRFDGYDTQKSDKIQEIRASYSNIKDFWFDGEAQVSLFEDSIKEVYGETFPIFSPNLGPCIYASYFGVNIEYGEDTSWAKHCLDEDLNIDITKLKIHKQCAEWQKTDEITKLALSRCKDKYFVGYTDLHPSLDCIADFTGAENLCVALYHQSQKVKEFANKIVDEFKGVFDYYHNLLKGQPSCNWLGIPTQDRLHIPSCDFSAMISSKQFEEFCLPNLQKEVKYAKNNVFHLDGVGVAKHLDLILDIKEIKAVQWVQGVGADQAIMPWVPLIKKIQQAGKSVVVILDEFELTEFISEVSPKGIFLTMRAKRENRKAIIKILEGWK